MSGPVSHKNTIQLKLGNCVLVTLRFIIQPQSHWNRHNKVHFVQRVAASFVCHTQTGLRARKVIHSAGIILLAFRNCTAARRQLCDAYWCRTLGHQDWDQLVIFELPFPSAEGTF